MFTMFAYWGTITPRWATEGYSGAGGGWGGGGGVVVVVVVGDPDMYRYLPFLSGPYFDFIRTRWGTVKKAMYKLIKKLDNHSSRLYRALMNLFMVTLPGQLCIQRILCRYTPIRREI